MPRHKSSRMRGWPVQKSRRSRWIQEFSDLEPTFSETQQVIGEKSTDTSQEINDEELMGAKIQGIGSDEKRLQESAR